MLPIRTIGYLQQPGSAFTRATTAHPDFPQLLFDLLASQLPSVDLRQALPQLEQLFLNAVLLARRSHPQELILVGVFAQAKCERVRVISLQRGTRGYCDEG